MRSLPRGAAAYVSAVVVAGAVALTVAALRGRAGWLDVAFLAVLYSIGDFARVTTKLRTLSISVTFPVALAALLLAGPWAAAIACAVGALAVPRRTAWFKRAFNASQVALSVLSAGFVYEICPGHGSRGFSSTVYPEVLFAVAAAGFAYCVVNCLLVGVVVSITTKSPLSRVWWSGMSETVVSNLGYGLIGLIIAALWSGGVGAVAALLVLAPLVIARWAFQQYAEQRKAYEATVSSLIQAVETKDYYTRGHSERVSQASVMIAQRLGMREDRLEMLRYAGMLHDVGKLGVPTKVLQKTGPLDDAEFAAIRLHPTRGFEMVNGISFLDEALMGIRHHHERVDGLGYPDGLAGANIPEFARVIAVADAFDSMTSTRSYRGARSVDAAIRELRKWAGAQFDATMVEALVEAVLADGWEAAIDATDAVVDPASLMVRDHDDPSSDMGAALEYDDFDVRAEQVS
jgi:HD domain